VEVMGEVGNWERLEKWLDVPHSKLQEIKQLPTSDRGKSRSLGRYWVNTAPGVSWKVLSHALYTCGEETALVMVKQYLPKGM